MELRIINYVITNWMKNGFYFYKNYLLPQLINSFFFYDTVLSDDDGTSETWNA